MFGFRRSAACARPSSARRFSSLSLSLADSRASRVRAATKIEIKNVTIAEDGSETVDGSQVETYDEHGRLTSEARYDADGKPGYRYSARYEDGELVETTHQNSDGSTSPRQFQRSPREKRTVRCDTWRPDGRGIPQEDADYERGAVRNRISYSVRVRPAWELDHAHNPAGGERARVDDPADHHVSIGYGPAKAGHYVLMRD